MFSSSLAVTRAAVTPARTLPAGIPPVLGNGSARARAALLLPTFCQVTWLSVLTVVFFPRWLSWLLQRRDVLLVAAAGQLSGGIILLPAHVSSVLCPPDFLLIFSIC